MSQSILNSPFEFTNDEVRVQVHRKPACRIEMAVKTSSQMVHEARKNAIKSVGKEISLPGFRKGRAPEAMIVQKFSRDVEKQLHKEVADLAFVAAQKIAKVPLLNHHSPVSFDLKNHSIEEGAELLFSFETEPQIPPVDPASFVPKPVERAEVADQQIEEAIRQMRFFYAQWKPIQDRPIQEGDYIMIDLDTIEGDNVQRVFHHIRFEVSRERMANWMQKLVIGAKMGDILDGVSEADSTATEAERGEFTPKKVRVTLLKVEASILPELDDAFATKVGASDVAHMRQSITDLLNKQADTAVQSALREQVNAFLTNHYPFDLPRSLVDTEKKHRFHQLMDDPKFKTKWDKMPQEERNNFDEKLTSDAAGAVRLFYLSRQIVQSAHIPITHKEVQQEAVSMYQAHGTQRVETDQLPKEIYALALSKVMLAKAQDFIMKSA